MIPITFAKRKLHGPSRTPVPTNKIKHPYESRACAHPRSFASRDVEDVVPYGSPVPNQSEGLYGIQRRWHGISASPSMESVRRTVWKRGWGRKPQIEFTGGATPPLQNYSLFIIPLPRRPLRLNLTLHYSLTKKLPRALLGVAFYFTSVGIPTRFSY